METKKWEAMLTAVELGSFTRAAARLGVTQSGLTHMMKALERETGLSLLLRDRYGVRPTAAGEQLLPAVRDLLQAAGRLEGQIAAQSGQRRENIRVAAYSSICMHWLPTIVRQDQGRYDWVPLWDDPLLAILPPDWPLGGAERFPVSAFSGREFLMPSLGFDLDILEVFETQNVRPDIRSNTAVEDAAILSMVEHGLGVSVLSQLVLQGRRDNVLALPLDPPACRRIGIAVPSLEEAPGHVRRFIEYSQRIVGALHGAPDSSPQQ